MLAGVPPHTASGGGTHPADASCSARISRARATSTSSPAVSGGSGLRGTSPGTNDSTSRPCSSTPSGSGAPVNPASRRWARYACTVRLNGRSGRRTVSPIRTIPWVTPSPVSGSPSLIPPQPSWASTLAGSARLVADGGYGGEDGVDRGLRLGHHRHVRPGDFGDRRACPLGHAALDSRRDNPVLGPDHGPARDGLPGGRLGPGRVRAEGDRALARGDQPPVRLGQVLRERLVNSRRLQERLGVPFR